MRGGPAGAGGPLPGPTADVLAFFQDGKARFAEVESVIAQPDFYKPGNPVTLQGTYPNLAFRIATPLFGLGLVESITDASILPNMQESPAEKKRYGISGHANASISGVANRSANDGTITRFGWKAQNKSLLLFAAEAYNVEMGITNEMFRH